MSIYHYLIPPTEPNWCMHKQRNHGNAHGKIEYCQHLREMKHEMIQNDGKQIMANTVNYQFWSSCGQRF